MRHLVQDGQETSRSGRIKSFGLSRCMMNKMHDAQQSEEGCKTIPETFLGMFIFVFTDHMSKYGYDLKRLIDPKL